MGKRSRQARDAGEAVPEQDVSEQPPVSEEEELEDPGEEQESDTSSGSSDGSGLEGDGSEGEEPEDEDPDDTTVDVTLEFFDPKESDFLGLKALLQSYLDGAAFACSELVDLVIKQGMVLAARQEGVSAHCLYFIQGSAHCLKYLNQPTVGTVVKSGDDEDPIGVLTALSTRRYRSAQCLADIRQHLLQHCSDPKLKAQLTAAWEGERTALLVSERLINCPPQLAPPLHQALFDEIEWATEDEPTEELRDFFRLDTFIALTRVFRDPTAAAATPAKGGTSKKRPKAAVPPTLIFARPEDEFFHKHCSGSFTFATGRAVAADELQPLRLVMLLSKQQAQAARRELDAVVGNAAAEEGPNS